MPTSRWPVESLPASARSAWARPGTRQLGGVVVDVEVVDVDLQGALVDGILGLEAGGGDLGVVREILLVDGVEIEHPVAHVLVVADLGGVDLGAAAEALAVGLALLVTGDGGEAEGAQAALGADAEQSLVLLVEADEARVRQRQGGVARLNLLEDVVLVALVVELDLVELVLQVLPEGAGQAPGVLVDADVDRLPHLSLDGEVGLLVHAQGRELRGPSRQGPHLVGRPAALAADRGGVRAVDPQRALVADEALNDRRRRDRHPPLQPAPAPLAHPGLPALAVAHLLEPFRPVDVAVPQLQIAVHGQRDRQAVVEAGRARLIVGARGVDGHLLAGEGGARLHLRRRRRARSQQGRSGAQSAVGRGIVEQPEPGAIGGGLQADPGPGGHRGEGEQEENRSGRGEAGSPRTSPRHGGGGYGHGSVARGPGAPDRRRKDRPGARAGRAGEPAAAVEAPGGPAGRLICAARDRSANDAITFWEPTGGIVVRQSRKPRPRKAATSGASETRSSRPAGGAVACRTRPVGPCAHTGGTGSTRGRPPAPPGGPPQESAAGRPPGPFLSPGS